MSNSKMKNHIIGRGWSFPPRIGASGGIALTNDRNEIEEAIEIILGTGVGQRVIWTSFGSRLQELVFAPNNERTAAEAKRMVEDALAMWEPRIRVIEVTVHTDDGAALVDNRLSNSQSAAPSRLVIEIEYMVKSTRDRRSLIYPYYLIPQE